LVTIDFSNNFIDGKNTLFGAATKNINAQKSTS